MKARNSIFRLSVSRARLTQIFLIAYGLFLYALNLRLLVVQIAGASDREIEIQQSLGVLASGGPPLTGTDPTTGAMWPIPLSGDDQGIYLFVPLLAHALGMTDAYVAIALFAVLLLSVIPVVYPLIVLRLFDSFAAALILPLALVASSGFMLHGDIYWVVGWCVLLLLPPVYLVYRRWGPSRMIVLVALVVVASLASSIRSYAGLPVLVSAVLVVLYRQPSWTRRLGSAALLLTVYLVVGGGVLAVARSYRDRTLGVDLSTSAPTTAHPFWHPVYLGLGYLPNRYGIRWDDDNGAWLAVQREDPTARYLSPEYEASLRRQFLDIARSDPGFVLSTYLTKTVVLLSHTLGQFGWAWLVLPLALIAARLRQVRDSWRYVSLVLPAFLTNAIPPVLTIPDPAFEIGWFAACEVALLFAAGFVISQGENGVRALAAKGRARRDGGWRRSATS